ncbi:hypothetical protein BC827DRAFT_665882 [Russula dissimulans]|nr:hypothetical protein BC827DRAFT_665882 [Russula dissimulans]
MALFQVVLTNALTQPAQQHQPYLCAAAHHHHHDHLVHYEQRPRAIHRLLARPAPAAAHHHHYDHLAHYQQRPRATHRRPACHAPWQTTPHPLPQAPAAERARLRSWISFKSTPTPALAPGDHATHARGCMTVCAGRWACGRASLSRRDRCVWLLSPLLPEGHAGRQACEVGGLKPHGGRLKCAGGRVETGMRAMRARANGQPSGQAG